MSYVQSPPISVKSSICPSTSNSEDQWNIVKEDAKVSDESRGKMSFSSSSKAPLRASQMIGKETNKEEVEVDEDVTDEALETDEDVSLNSSYTATIIDADKVNYPFYLTWAREHLTESGLIVVDNTLWSGKVLQKNPDAHTKAIQEANAMVASWDDFVTSLLPVRDGMMLVKRKRK
jgi:predicted O-methyltransferase YrrM